MWCKGSPDAYRDMEDFIETILDVNQADHLSIAIS